MNVHVSLEAITYFLLRIFAVRFILKLSSGPFIFIVLLFHLSLMPVTLFSICRTSTLHYGLPLYLFLLFPLSNDVEAQVLFRVWLLVN